MGSKIASQWFGTAFTLFFLGAVFDFLSIAFGDAEAIEDPFLYANYHAVPLLIFWLGFGLFAALFLTGLWFMIEDRRLKETLKGRIALFVLFSPFIIAALILSVTVCQIGFLGFFVFPSPYFFNVFFYSFLGLSCLFLVMGVGSWLDYDLKIFRHKLWRWWRDLR